MDWQSKFDVGCDSESFTQNFANDLESHPMSILECQSISTFEFQQSFLQKTQNHIQCCTWSANPINLWVLTKFLAKDSESHPTLHLECRSNQRLSFNKLLCKSWSFNKVGAKDSESHPKSNFECQSIPKFCFQQSFVQKNWNYTQRRTFSANSYLCWSYNKVPFKVVGVSSSANPF